MHYLYAAVAAFVVDVSSKWIVAQHGFDYTYNIAQYRESWWITVVSGILGTILMSWLMFRPAARPAHIPAGLCVGGALGNIMSMLFGPPGVMDFIVIQNRWYANVADVTQFVGVTWIILLVIMSTARKWMK